MWFLFLYITYKYELWYNFYNEIIRRGIYITIASIYKSGDESIFVCDFRLTERSNNTRIQKDISYKLVTIDNKMGLFLAGDVNKWKIALRNIELIKKQITFENILEEGNPFIETLLDFSLSNNAGSCSAIGFIIDETIKQNKVFEIEIKPLLGCRISEIENESFKVIGSGKNIPNIENRIHSKIQNNIAHCKGNSYSLACIIRDEIKKSIIEYSDNGFEVLGISPVLQISYLDKSYFKVVGEEIEGGSFNKDSYNTFNYSFEGENNKVILKDNLTELRQELIDVYDISPGMEGEKFNPEKL